MRLKVLKNFTDKYDNSKKYTAGQTINVKKERGEELLAFPIRIVEKVEQKQK